MNKVFESEHGIIHVKEEDENILISGFDIGNMLGYKSPAQSIRNAVDKQNIIKDKIGDDGRNYLLLNEAGLNQLFEKCRRPNAGAIHDWIKSILLDIKSGKIEPVSAQFKEIPDEKEPEQIQSEETNLDLNFVDKMLNDPDFGIKVFEALKAEKAKTQKLTEENEILKPKGEFFDTVNSSKDTLSLGETAKVLNMGIGRNLMCKLLRAEGIFTKTNLPIQRYILDGSFRVIEYPLKHGEEVSIQMETRVYQKGVNLIRETLKRVYEENEKEME